MQKERPANPTGKIGNRHFIMTSCMHVKVCKLILAIYNYSPSLLNSALQKHLSVLLVWAQNVIQNRLVLTQNYCSSSAACAVKVMWRIACLCKIQLVSSCTGLYNGTCALVFIDCWAVYGIESYSTLRYWCIQVTVTYTPLITTEMAYCT